MPSVGRETHTQVALTGNPFVDTGLGVIAALCRLDDVTTLTLDGVREVFGDGRKLARWNSKLKTFTQVFGTNGPLFQASYGYKKGAGPSELNLSIYCNTLLAFLKAMQAAPGGLPCVSCGNPTDFNFAETTSAVLDDAGKQPPEEKWVGRDWFPLSGSMGSDAQALPGASRPVHLCPTCLFGVHYLPLALILLEGRPAVFQCTSITFWYELIRDLVTGEGGVDSRVTLQNFETPGAKEGSQAVSRRLLAFFDRIQEANRLADIPEGTTLFIWQFTNSGAEPDCQINEVPNSALRFLRNAIRAGLRLEVERLVGDERQKGFIRCISEKVDYPGLYPHDKQSGASERLFTLYQTEICGRSSRTLSIARLLARRAFGTFTAKEIPRLQRVEAFRTPWVRNTFRSLMWELAMESEFLLNDYLLLFPPAEDQHGVAVNPDGWELIRYYFCLDAETDADSRRSLVDADRAAEGRAEVTDRVTYYSRRIFDAYVAEHGINRFESNVLQGRDIGIRWLQRQFVRLAPMFPGFTHDSWDALCFNDAGRSCAGELLFQMRLLWAQWLRATDASCAGMPKFLDGSGLPTFVEEGIEKVFETHVKERGMGRLRRDVLPRLETPQTGLRWFRRNLTGRGSRRDNTMMSKDDWEDFLNDATGRKAPLLRLFQMNLYLANLIRQEDVDSARVGEQRTSKEGTQ